MPTKHGTGDGRRDGRTGGQRRPSTASMTKLSSTGSQSARRGSRASAQQEETRDRLYQRAAELGVNGRSRMTKAELMEAIQAKSGGKQARG